MGKGKKPKGEEEVLGQIFDFIFKEAKKKPGKRKPIKPTGISTSGEVVDGLAAALEQPGLFVSDQILSSLNDSLTIEFGRIKANESGSQNAKFTTTSLISFLSDPNKFFDKPKEGAKMGIRDAMKAGFMGRIQQELISNAWAKKYNLDLDARKAIRGHYEAEKIGREAEAQRAFAMSAGAAIGGDDNSRKNYVISRSANLVGKEMFGRDGWESMSEARKIALQQAIIGGNIAVKKFMTSTYGDPSLRIVTPSARLGAIALSKYDNLVARGGLKISPTGFNNGDKGINLLDLNTYNKLEIGNIKGRIRDMEIYIARNPGLSINEKQKIQMGIDKLQQASVIVTGNHLDLDKVQESKIELRRMVEDYKSKLEAAKRAGDQNGVRYYKDQIKNLKEGDRQLNALNFWGKIGKREGQIDSLKDVLGEGLAPNALLSVLNGSLYDKNRNSFYLPIKEEEISFGSHTWDLKDETGTKKPETHAEEITFFCAADGANKLSSAYKAYLTNIYYLTPRSILRTLFVNGEGFVYLAYLKRQRFITEYGVQNLDFVKLLKNDSTLLTELSRKGLTKGHIASLKFSGRLAQIFSFGQRKRDMIKNWMDDHFFKQMRQKIYNSLIKKITDAEALALLKTWLAKGGFEIVAKAIVIGILDALGIAATGGFGSFIVPILSVIVVDILYGLVKIVVQVVLLVALGMIGFIFFVSSGAKKDFDAQTYAYTNVVPGEVVTNPNFKGTSPIIQPDDPSNIGNFVGGTLPDGEKCLLGSGSFHCTQGPYGSYSHQRVAAVDITGVNYFYAPAFCGNNNCKVTYSGSTSCTNGYAGGMMIFTASYGGNTYEFKLIHVQPGAGSGATLSSGQRVARVMTVQETTNACSSGMHLHLQTKMNGSVVNPRDVLNNNTSSGGFSCSVSVCDP
jgi:hypothetical protein